MGTYLVTGGCGFIGSHLCDRLIRLGHRVRVLDNLSTGHRQNIADTVELIVGDVADRSAVVRAMTDIDGCFHLAAVASVQRSIEDWLGTHATNQTGTIAVFDAAKWFSRPPVPVVYASSAAIYGDGTAPLRESAQAYPLTAYGADKFGCELHARVATLVHSVPTCGLRFFNVFGPRQDPHSPYSGVISIFTHRLLSGQGITIFGDGRQQRDFVYVEDVVDHLMAAMNSMNGTPRVFNVCSGRPTTIQELIHTLGDTIGITPRIEYQPTRAGDILISVGDPTLGIAGLGIRASTTLQEGLRQSIGSMRPILAA